jgi:hypothetical protein
MNAEIWRGNIFESRDLEVIEREGRLVLLSDLGARFETIIGILYWLRNVCSGELLFCEIWPSATIVLT